MFAAHADTHSATSTSTLLERLNGPRHELALWIFTAIVLAHWAEHLLQAFQIYALGWPVPDARGLLGHFYPWLVTSEALHYGYALVMLVGLWVLRSGFTGSIDRRWWTIALGIQFFHHFEHALLLTQATLGYNFFGRPVPTSLVQLWVPRVELHMFYNSIVFIPMVIAMYYHVFPPAADAAGQKCPCAWNHRLASAASVGG